MKHFQAINPIAKTVAILRRTEYLGYFAALYEKLTKTSKPPAIRRQLHNALKHELDKA